jgi:pseudouridine-5'-phosphate glycosidase
VSTTLIPPTFYVVKPPGRPGCVYATIADAAGAIVMLGSSPAAVGAVTGRRARGLTESELNELERHVGARRVSSSRKLGTGAVERGWRANWVSSSRGRVVAG